jgi:D-alanine-D-alanine ligase
MRIAVLMGGWGEERAISLASGAAVCRALWSLGHHPRPLDAKDDLDRALRAMDPDLCFLALHGRMGEDGTVQGLLEVLGLPYTGSGVLASGLAMDKPTANRLFAYANLPVPPGYAAHGPDEALERHGDLGFPCIVKPARGGSSVGVRLVAEVSQLGPAVRDACAFGGQALVERRIRGREVTVGLLDGEVLGSLEIAHGQDTFDFGATYRRRPKTFSPPRMSATRVTNVETLARAAYETLGCRGPTRVDLLCPEEGNEVLLELNTLPGLTERSLLPRIARTAGLTFEALVARILASAACERPRAPHPDAAFHAA